MELTVDALEYLHDADLHGVNVDSTTPNRSVSFAATFHDDCSASYLNGRSIQVVLDDVILLRAEVHGATTAPEKIDHCRLSVSAQTQKSLAEWIEMSGRKPACSLTLVTHSGSSWEIMCESIAVHFV